ncbi:hypothetical protein D3C72_2272980 [compost metagenome]
MRWRRGEFDLDHIACRLGYVDQYRLPVAEDDIALAADFGDEAEPAGAGNRVATHIERELDG